MHFEEFYLFHHLILVQWLKGQTEWCFDLAKDYCYYTLYVILPYPASGFQVASCSTAVDEDCDLNVDDDDSEKFGKPQYPFYYWM